MRRQICRATAALPLAIACGLVAIAGCGGADVQGSSSSNPDERVATSSEALTVGTWTTLPTNPISQGANAVYLLTDGSVFVESGGADWHQFTRLVPDATGNYANGTWVQTASSIHARLYYPAFVMKDGRLWVGGGEYIQDADNDENATEIYDPVKNTWTAGPEGLLGDIGDTGAAILGDGRILVSYRFGSQTQIYNPSTNAFTAGPNSLAFTGDEAGFQLLADGTVFDAYATAQRYLPSSNSWIATAAAPITVSSDGEEGPLVYLQDGRVFVMADNGPTAFFTPPSTLTGSGSWTVGPSEPSGGWAGDTPAAIMPNGRVLVEATAGLFGNFTLYEFDPSNNTYTTVPQPPGSTPAVGFATRMLVLPNGQILFADAGEGFWVYTPTGSPQSSWRPTVSSVTRNSDGTYTLAGTQLNGNSYGASYGDDAMMSSAYPIVYLKDSAGHLLYARTYNFSTMAIRTGSASVSCNFSTAGVGSGSYNLFVSANGVSSATGVPVTISDTCSAAYTQSSCSTYQVNTWVSNLGHNWMCTNGNCANCATDARCAPGGTGCPWGTVWTDENACGTNACAPAYAKSSCLTYQQGQPVSSGGHNWSCSNGNCRNCATDSRCAPGGSGCPWGVVWTDDGTCH
jgi:hypothetical protein